MLFFLFNGAVFILIGLQLRRSSARSRFRRSCWSAGVWPSRPRVIVSRLVWVFPAAFVRRALDPRHRSARRAGRPRCVRPSCLDGRGCAASSRSPPRFRSPKRSPVVRRSQRDLILFITFCVIPVTLVGQGFSLPWIIRRFNVREADPSLEHVSRARVLAAQARDRLHRSLGAYLHNLDALGSGGENTRAMRIRSSTTPHAWTAKRVPRRSPSRWVATCARAALEAERRAIDDLRHKGIIPDEVFRQLQYDIDLAESRLPETLGPPI